MSVHVSRKGLVVRMILDRDQVQSSDVCQLDQLGNRLNLRRLGCHGESELER